jgi:predicted nucleotidyltransferase
VILVRRANKNVSDTTADFLGVILYGSQSRGDTDEYSDIDLCVVCPNMPSNEVRQIGDRLANAWTPEIPNISLYRADEFKAMVLNGSLFAWHLFLEAQILVDADGYLARTLHEIGPYQRGLEDIQSYSLLLADVIGSAETHELVSSFDLSTLFTIARNTAMVLCFVAGAPRFGRCDVFEKAGELYRDKFEFKTDLYKVLEGWKLWYARGVPTPERIPSRGELHEITTHVGQLVRFALKETENGKTISRTRGGDRLAIR